MNIVECSCRTKPTNVAREQANKTEDNKKAVVICKSFANHESVKVVEENIRKKSHSGKVIFQSFLLVM